jgi:hypothetical protein
MSESREPASYDLVTLGVAPAGRRWLVNGVIMLRSAQDDRGDLLLDCRWSPLLLRHVGLSCGTAYGVATGPDRNAVVKMELDLTRARSWDGATLTCEFEWAPEDVTRHDEMTDGAPAWQAPCLVLPDMLPRLIAMGDALQSVSSRPLTRISFDGHLPPDLGAGWIRSSETRLSDLTALLQLSLFPAVRGGMPLPDTGSVGVLSTSPDTLATKALQQARAYASPLYRYLGRELGCADMVRPVLCLSDIPVPPLYGAVAGYAPISPAHAGAKEPNVGKPVTIIRLFAQAWVGGGLRLSGENAAELTIAIGGALGMAWLQKVGDAAAVERAIATHEATLSRARQSGEWRLAHQSLEIQLPLFRGMQDPRVVQTLRALIRENWGSYLPQQVLVDELRQAGVSVPAVYM